MRLSQVLASHVSSGSRTRGFSYFVNGAVRRIDMRDGIVRATVDGAQPYHVWIEPHEGVLRSSCTCPYFLDRLDICKHIWAALLAAEAKSLPILTPGPAPARVTFEALDPNAGADLEPLDDDVDEMEDVDEPWSPPVAPGTDVRAPRAAEPFPPWKQLFASLVPEPLPASLTARARFASGQLLYVIDIAASLAASELVVEVMTRDRKASGDWGKPRAARLSSADLHALPDAAEREILERLLGARLQVGWTGYELTHELSRFRLSGILLEELLPLLCATGRCITRTAPPLPEFGVLRRPFSKPDPPVLTPLAWDAGPPWRFAVAIQRDEAAATYVVDGWLERDGERMPVSTPRLVLADHIVILEGQAAALDHGGAFAWLSALRRTGPVIVPMDAQSMLVDALLAQPPPLVTTPEELRVEVADGEPRPRLLLRPDRVRPDRLFATLTFDYDGIRVPFDAPQRTVRAEGSPRAIRRDPDRERHARDTLIRLGLRPDWSHEARGPALQLGAHLLPRVTRTLLDEGWQVEASGQLYRRPGAVSLHVSSGIDWFDLRGRVDYGDQTATLPALLAAVQRGESFVTLDDGSIGLLPEEWLERHRLMTRAGSLEGESLRFKPSQVGLLDALLAAQPRADWDEGFARAREALRAFETIQPADPPATFAGTLRGYQREGLGWLAFLQRLGVGGCLADDMGLGKTVMVLALLDARRDAQPPGDRRPSLVVAPRSVGFNWRQEAARFTPRLEVLEYTGAGRADLHDRFAAADLVITTYGTLRRDAARLAGESFDYVVLDEAQAIKNAHTASAKACRLLKARQRLALTGTPIENHVRDLYSLFEFLNPGLLGRLDLGGADLGDEELALLSRALRPFLLRRTKDQVASDLPAKLEQTIYCEMEKPQRALYTELRDHYRRTLLDGVDAAGLKRMKIRVLEALLRLRQAACHPELVDHRRSGDASAKLDVLMSRLREIVDEGHRALVFSQFTSLLAIVRRELDRDGITYEYLDGRTRDREARVARFQADGGCPLFLISLKAGGVGLNLTAADSVFLLDPWWNPAVEAQAIDRTHRIGQHRRVFAYRLITRDTVEERVLELQQRKRKLADQILSATSAPLQNLKREDLELLLS